MFLIYSALFFVVLGAICNLRYYQLQGKNDYNDGAVILYAIAGVIVLIAFLSTGQSYSSQISDFENIKKYEKVEAIYANKAKALTAEFAKYLAGIYPEHEKNIYEKISPEQVDIYLVKYPELRASETIMELTRQINQLQSDVYGQQIKKEDTLKNIRYRLRSPWIFHSWMPTK